MPARSAEDTDDRMSVAAAVFGHGDGEVCAFELRVIEEDRVDIMHAIGRGHIRCDDRGRERPFRGGEFDEVAVEIGDAVDRGRRDAGFEFFDHIPQSCLRHFHLTRENF